MLLACIWAQPVSWEDFVVSRSPSRGCSTTVHPSRPGRLPSTSFLIRHLLPPNHSALLFWASENIVIRNTINTSGDLCKYFKKFFVMNITNYVIFLRQNVSSNRQIIPNKHISFRSFTIPLIMRPLWSHCVNKSAWLRLCSSPNLPLSYPLHRPSRAH